MSIDQIEILDNKISDLQRKADAQKKEKAAVQSRLNDIRQKISLVSSAAKQKKQGIIWVAIGVVLAILEVMMLAEILIVGYSDFDVVDLVLIAIPLIIGLTKLKKAGAAKNAGSISALEQECQALDLQMKKFQELDEQLEEAEEERSRLTTYTGRKWDISSFVATHANVAAMEKDFEDMLVSLKYSYTNSDIINSWLCLNEIQQSNASLSQDAATTAAFDRGVKEMKQSGSWKLEIALLAMCPLKIVILSFAVGTGDGNMTFEEALASSDVRPAQTQEEKDLLALVSEVMPKVVSALRAELKKSVQ